MNYFNTYLPTGWRFYFYHMMDKPDSIFFSNETYAKNHFDFIFQFILAENR